MFNIMPPEQNNSQEQKTTDVASVATASTASESITNEPASKKSYITGAVVLTVALGIAYVLFFTNLGNGLLGGGAPATINGTEISTIEYENSINAVTQEFTQQGFDTSSPEAQEQIQNDALNRLINTELLLQAAAADGYTVDEEKINEQLATLTAQFGGEDALNTQLEVLQLTPEMVREDIYQQLLVDAYLADQETITTITVTEDEIVSFYGDLREQYGEQLPELAEIRDRIQADITTQKQQTVLSEILADLRADATIVTN